MRQRREIAHLDRYGLCASRRARIVRVHDPRPLNVLRAREEGAKARIGIQSRGGESGQRAAASIDDDQDISRPVTVSDENVRTVACEHRDARWRKRADAARGPDPGFGARARTQAATEQSP